MITFKNIDGNKEFHKNSLLTILYYTGLKYKLFTQEEISLNDFTIKKHIKYLENAIKGNKLSKEYWLSLDMEETQNKLFQDQDYKKVMGEMIKKKYINIHIKGFLKVVELLNIFNYFKNYKIIEYKNTYEIIKK